MEVVSVWPLCISILDLCDDLSEMIVRMIGESKIIARMAIPLSPVELNTLVENNLIDWKEMSHYYPITKWIANLYGDKLEWKILLNRYLDATIDAEVMLHLGGHVSDSYLYHAMGEPMMYRNSDIASKYRKYINWQQYVTDPQIKLLDIVPFIKSVLSDRTATNSFCVRFTFAELENTVPEYLHLLDWVTISRTPGLSTSVIRKWIGSLNLDLIFKYQKLPSDIIESYKYSIQGGSIIIPTYQSISTEMIIANILFYDIDCVILHQCINIDLIEQISHIYPSGLKNKASSLSKSKCITISMTECGIVTIVDGNVVKEELFDHLSHGKALFLDNQTGKTKRF
jgi:hypothetical protein